MKDTNRRQGARSTEAFAEATRLIPGGVNSPVRAFGSVGGTPFVVDKGLGAWLRDIDGNSYIDYVMSWGPLILGHADPDVVISVQKAAARGMSYGAPTRGELELAALVQERMPWIERLRLVSSGTEACMTAIRLARGATEREVVVKFDGGYHGHSDAFLVKAGSGLATAGLPASGGVPPGVTAATLSLPYNDLPAVTEAFAKRGADIAAVIVEPVADNMGVVPPEHGFLEGLRTLTSKHGALLVFDEVITGFRVAPGGATVLFGITPDLVCLGKILGGGLPIGGIGGRRDVMDLLAPLGPVYQAGTLSGNPLSTAAGAATLERLGDASVYRTLRQYADDLIGGLTEASGRAGVPVSVGRCESLFTVFFGDQPVRNFEEAKACDMERYARFFHAMLDRRVFLAPSGFEAWFVSLAHTAEHLKRTLEAAAHALEQLPAD